MELEEKLFSEKNRIQEVFSKIAKSLSNTFFNLTAQMDNYVQSTGSDVLQQVLDYTRELLCAEKCALFLVDLSETSLVLERVSGVVDFEKLKDVATYDLRVADLPGTGVTPWVLHRKQPFNAKDFDELVFNSEGHWKGNWDIPMYGGPHEARNKFQCVYMVPLMVGEKPIGVLKYENRTCRKKYFDKADERLIDMISALVTNLVISQRIERNRYDQILPTISTALVTYFDRPIFYEELLERCRCILKADLCSLFLLDEQENLILKCIVGINTEKRDRLRNFGYQNYHHAKGLTPWILLRGASFNVRSYPDLRGRSEGHHIGKWDEVIYDGQPEKQFKSLYSIPLIIGEEKIGVFKVENKNVPPYYFTESDERLFDLIGHLIAIGVKYERSRQNEQYLAQMARIAELGYLAAGISHEFNNYLQRFLVTARAAKDKSDKFPDKSVSDDLEQIIQDVRQVSKVIEAFREIRSRIEQTDKFNLDELIYQIIKISRQRFIVNNIEVDYINRGISEVQLNPVDIQTIVINLINNALESILESASTKRIVKVDIAPEQSERIRIEVADSGAGLSQMQQQSIFAPFYTTKPGGMGVGLFWVQRLVNDMGGKINIYSPNEWGGATFQVILPQFITPERSLNE